MNVLQKKVHISWTTCLIVTAVLFIFEEIWYVHYFHSEVKFPELVFFYFEMLLPFLGVAAVVGVLVSIILALGKMILCKDVRSEPTECDQPIVKRCLLSLLLGSAFASTVCLCIENMAVKPDTIWTTYPSAWLLPFLASSGILYLLLTVSIRK